MSSPGKLRKFQTQKDPRPAGFETTTLSLVLLNSCVFTAVWALENDEVFRTGIRFTNYRLKLRNIYSILFCTCFNILRNMTLTFYLTQWRFGRILATVRFFLSVHVVKMMSLRETPPAHKFLQMQPDVAPGGKLITRESFSFIL